MTRALHFRVKSAFSATVTGLASIFEMRRRAMIGDMINPWLTIARTRHRSAILRRCAIRVTRRIQIASLSRTCTVLAIVPKPISVARMR
jgi:hypothetical protein